MQIKPLDRANSVFTIRTAEDIRLIAKAAGAMKPTLLVKRWCFGPRVILYRVDFLFLIHLQYNPEKEKKFIF